jgi:hypothetical protein
MGIHQALAWLSTPVGAAFMGWLFATIVGGMPQPTTSSVWYTWLYNTLQRIAANHSNTVGKITGEGKL